MNTLLPNICGNIRRFTARIRNPSRSRSQPEVFMYHNITRAIEHDCGPWKASLTKTTLEQQIEILSNHRTITSMDQLISYITNGTQIPDNSVVITFDDGYTDFNKHVLPVLEKYEIPATVYIPTKLMESGRAPYEFRLATALLSSSEVQIDVMGKKINRKLNSEADAMNTYNILRKQLKRLRTKDRNKIISKLGNSSNKIGKVMTKREIQSLDKHQLITIGGHSHEHFPLAQLKTDEQIQNINKCHNRLTELLGTPPQHFSFPYGSFDDSAIRAVKNAGFKSAVTTQSRPVSARDWGRPYTIPRIDAATGSVISRV